MISSLVTVIKLSVATVMDSLNLTHREAMYLLDHVGADKDIITLRLSTTRVGGDKIYFFRGYQGPGRLGTWEEEGLGRKGERGIWEERGVDETSYDFRHRVLVGLFEFKFGNFGGMGNKGERYDSLPARGALL